MPPKTAGDFQHLDGIDAQVTAKVIVFAYGVPALAGSLHGVDGGAELLQQPCVHSVPHDVLLR
jgi:hypothetical protein